MQKKSVKLHSAIAIKISKKVGSIMLDYVISIIFLTFKKIVQDYGGRISHLLKGDRRILLILAGTFGSICNS